MYLLTATRALFRWSSPAWTICTNSLWRPIRDRGLQYFTLNKWSLWLLICLAGPRVMLDLVPGEHVSKTGRAKYWLDSGSGRSRIHHHPGHYCAPHRLTGFPEMCPRSNWSKGTCHEFSDVLSYTNRRVCVCVCVCVDVCRCVFVCFIYVQNNWKDCCLSAHCLYLEANKLLPDCQCGFRKGRSTDTLLLLLLCDIYGSAHNSQLTLLALFHVSTAFDTLNHEILLKRLEILMGPGASSTCKAWCINVS